MNARPEHDRDEEEAARRSFERALNSKRNELSHVRLCQSMPESERVLPGSVLFFDCGYIYLMEKLSRVRNPHSVTYVSSPHCPYKIGATNRPIKARRNELWNGKRLILRAKYATPVAFALEEALHSHFEPFRIKRQGQRRKGERTNQQGEFFRLRPEELEGFTATVAKVERWVLVAEEARLELEIMRMGTGVWPAPNRPRTHG
jgi:T5orf172 domain